MSLKIHVYKWLTVLSFDPKKVLSWRPGSRQSVTLQTKRLDGRSAEWRSLPILRDIRSQVSRVARRSPVRVAFLRRMRKTRAGRTWVLCACRLLGRGALKAGKPGHGPRFVPAPRTRSPRFAVRDTVILPFLPPLNSNQHVGTIRGHSRNGAMAANNRILSAPGSAIFGKLLSVLRTAVKEPASRFSSRRRNHSKHDSRFALA